MKNLIDDKRSEDVCKIGQGAACCRYLGMGPNGMECLKHDEAMAEILDRKVLDGKIGARGDNCEGLK